MPSAPGHRNQSGNRAQLYRRDVGTSHDGNSNQNQQMPQLRAFSSFQRAGEFTCTICQYVCACVQMYKCAFVYVLVRVSPECICGKNTEAKTLKNMHRVSG